MQNNKFNQIPSNRGAFGRAPAMASPMKQFFLAPASLFRKYLVKQLLLGGKMYEMSIMSFYCYSLFISP
jgi:hypothetical protein